MLLWSGDFVSAIGSGLTSFGLGVYIFQQTGKASQMALVTLLAFLPSLLLGPVAGVLADRHDRRLLMVLGDSLSAVGLLFILVSLMQGEARLWQICVGVTISSVFASLLEPAYKATITAKPAAWYRLPALPNIWFRLFWPVSFSPSPISGCCFSLISAPFL